ncbi:MAG TPA: tRNA adenosine(34) deaminase TadA [Candidatus Anaerobiospirillum stercoravium]|nr:tRNA adenosine(34) deaminase TadA [Candidatus Anaerobiospirillum stercoravium]
MGMALEQAVLAYRHGEVPVGAVVVVPRENDAPIVVAAHNSTIEQHDPTAHAEMLALRKAGSELKNYRLTGATLYVTLEPCCMCAMAALHARVERIVYGAADPRTGACGSVFDLAADPRHNHKLKIEGGLRAAESTQLLQRFFAERRAQSGSDQE